jgi:hypothetical protein
VIVLYAPTAEHPDYEWLERIFACPDCSTRVQFDLSDLTAIPSAKFVKDQDGWRAHYPCTTCGPMKMFREVQQTPDAGRVK